MRKFNILRLFIVSRMALPIQTIEYFDYLYCSPLNFPPRAKSKTMLSYFTYLLTYLFIYLFILFYVILFYFILFYFILFYFILFYFILFYVISFYFISFYFIFFYKPDSLRKIFTGQVLCIHVYFSDWHYGQIVSLYR